MKPVVLIIMDGFGLSPDTSENAIAAAKKPAIDKLIATYPHTSLGSAGLDVGLPPGQMGNSEVGHLNLGAGRIVYQDYTRINLAIEQGRLKDNEALVSAMKSVGPKNALHLMGLLSDGGVHSHITHLFALLDLAKSLGLTSVYVHAILDGRDVPPKSAMIYFDELEERFKSLGLGKVATVSGRYWTMDRDKRWDRTQASYRALTEGLGFKAKDSRDAVTLAYERGETDEFVKPTIVDDEGLVKDGDSLIFYNFRPDRARQITKAFVQDDFSQFERDRVLKVHFVCMTQYEDTIKAPVAFPIEYIKNTLGEVVSAAGLRQLRIAETEKYAHVTYFFNGGCETPNPGEDRVLIPSPKVPTYDLQPEMSAPLVTKAVLERIESDTYDMIIMNYANSDMVGHTGIFEAAVMAVEAVDSAVGFVTQAVLNKGGVVLLTADHGNAEKMFDEKTGQPHTAHTNNRVPFILISKDQNPKLRDDGILADVAPTILDLLKLEKPSEMTGRSLIQPL